VFSIIKETISDVMFFIYGHMRYNLYYKEINVQRDFVCLFCRDSINWYSVCCYCLIIICWFEERFLVKFLHTADWHLGASFYRVKMTEDQAFVLDQIRELIAEERPDFMVVAGDIYDRSVPPSDAVELLDYILNEIVLGLKVPIILIAGNHDSQERLDFGTKFMARQGLYMAGRVNLWNQPLQFEDTHGPFYVLPLTYAEPSIVRERYNNSYTLSENQDEINVFDHNMALSTMVKKMTTNIPNNVRTIAIAHAFVAGGMVSDSERQLSVGGAGNVDLNIFNRFTYTALGHLHRPQFVGSEKVRYSGSLLKYSFSEALHDKGVDIVEIDKVGNVTVRTKKFSFRHDVRCINGKMSELTCFPERYGDINDYLMVTLEDDGPVLDAMGRLKSIYPNILHIERPTIQRSLKLQGIEGDHRKQELFPMFQSFYHQVTGEPLSVEAADMFKLVVSNNVSCVKEEGLV